MDRGLQRDGEVACERAFDGRLVSELPALEAFVRRLVGGSAGGADAEDLLQEVVTRALRYAHSFDPARALGPWLRGTALRAFLDWRERRSRRPAELACPEETPDRPGAEAPAADESVEHLLYALSAEERDVLLRFHREAQPIAEIAAALGQPPGTIKSRLHRARRRLAEYEQEREAT